MNINLNKDLINPVIASVIVPVYNTEDFVKEALNSIIHQTLTDIEIIVINDGSTDNSLSIINELAEKDARVRIYTQENKGLSETRNRGLQVARGEYIYFMDSDDLLDKNALFECYKKCQANDLDFVFFDADIFGEHTKALNLNYHRTHLLKDDVYNGPSLLNFFFSNSGYQSSACLNFINSAYLKKIGISFYPGIIHEDELFTFLLFVQANRVGFISKAFFKRRLRKNSIIMVNGFSHKSLHGYITVIEELLKYKENIYGSTIGKLYDKHITRILGGILYNSRFTNVNNRYWILRNCVFKYWKYISIRDLLLLVVPISRYLKKRETQIT